MPPDDDKIEELKKLQEAEGEQVENVEVEDPEEQEEEPQGPTPRQAQRRERASKFKAEQERAAAAERERDDLRVRLAAAEAAQRYAPREDKPETKADPADKEIETISKEMAALQSQYGELVQMAEAAGKPIRQEIIDQFRSKWSELNQSRSEKIAEKTHRKMSGSAQQSGASPEELAAAAALKMRYSDVASHARAPDIARYASGLWQAHLASGGSNNQEQMDRIMDDARRKFGLAKSPAPSPATKARVSGVGAGATGANGTDNASEVKNFPVNKHQKAMAMEMYPDLPEKRAVQKWIQIQIKRGVKTA